MNWFRHYAGADFDPKFRTVARLSGQPIERVTFIWWALCGRQLEKGTIVGFDPEVIADHLGCDVTSVTSVTQAFHAKKMMLDDHLSAWQERQHQSPSAERTRRWREKKRRHSDVDSDIACDAVTPRTEQNRVESDSSLRSESRAIAAEFNATFWPAYPHKVGKPDALKAFRKARAKHPLPNIMDGLSRYKADKPPDRSWCNPSTFLNQERYHDEPDDRPQPKPNGYGHGRPSVVGAARAVLERMEQAAADHERHGAFADGDEIS